MIVRLQRTGQHARLGAGRPRKQISQNPEGCVKTLYTTLKLLFIVFKSIIDDAIGASTYVCDLGDGLIWWDLDLHLAIWGDESDLEVCGNRWAHGACLRRDNGDHPGLVGGASSRDHV